MRAMNDDRDLSYQSGFGNQHASEALPGALPMGRTALQPAVDLALRYSAAQGLLPRTLGPDEVWEGLPGVAAGGTMENAL